MANGTNIPGEDKLSEFEQRIEKGKTNVGNFSRELFDLIQENK